MQESQNIFVQLIRVWFLHQTSIDLYDIVEMAINLFCIYKGPNLINIIRTMPPSPKWTGMVCCELMSNTTLTKTSSSIHHYYCCTGHNAFDTHRAWTLPYIDPFGADVGGSAQWTSGSHPLWAGALKVIISWATSCTMSLWCGQFKVCKPGHQESQTFT